jgi:hypothetical protein
VVNTETQAKPKQDVVTLEHYPGRIPLLTCTCGWVYKHARYKVAKRALDKHTHKTGHQFVEKKR